MAGNQEDILYEDVKEEICRKIYDGIFEEGERIPAERTLAEMMNVSRITLRKSLELLAEKGLIIKEAGSGNRIALPNRGTPSSTDMIVLIAPAKNPFFADFIKKFQEYGQEYGSMILYAEKPRQETLEDSIYRFYRRHLQNVVVWPEDAAVDHNKLRKLRALGMNMVFFDTDKGLPYADSVVLDNRRAIHDLCKRIRERESGRIGYVGWEDGPEYSCRIREQAMLEEKGAEILVRLPWKQKKQVRSILYQYMEEHRTDLPPVIVFSDRECGTVVRDVFQELGINDVLLAGIDNFPGAKEAGAIICKQDIGGTIQKIFQCIEEQNRPGAKWHARLYHIEGVVE